MSGPKTTVYVLTPEQKKRLAEKRRIERERASAKEKLGKYSERLKKLKGLFSDEKKLAEELFSLTGNDGGFGKKTDELSRIIASCESHISKADTESHKSLIGTVESVNSSLTRAGVLINEIKAVSAQNKASLKADISSKIDSGFTTTFADIMPEKETEADVMKRELLRELNKLLENEALTEELISEIKYAVKALSEITDEAYLRNYSALSVRPLTDKCKNVISQYEKHHKEFEELYAEYTALCKLYYYEAQEYACTEDGITLLRNEIDRINSEIEEDDEQGYISDCIDEVMEEMGYSVLGSREVTKKNGKHFRNELYEYSEGTAVNVTYSSDGKIAMELGGIDTKDRLPNERETEILCDAMDSFCTDFPAIEKRLSEKGVVLKERISMLPVSAEYAQIINTSDYDMSRDAEKLKTEKRRRTARNNKTMKAE